VSEEEPLIPRTISGGAMLAIPITALLAGLGFLGQKALELDEQVITLVEQQRDDDESNRMLAVLATKITAIENRLQYRHKTIDLVHSMDEDLKALEAHFEDLAREVERLRDAR
jgi:hypothetical protein